MEPLRHINLTEQTAGHLRVMLRDIRLGGKLPGVLRMAAELGVSKTTLRAALRLLEGEGVVALSENGHSRHVTGQAAGYRHSLRIGILLPESLADENAQIQQFIGDLRERLESAGFSSFLVAQHPRGRRRDLSQLCSHLLKLRADGWLVMAGSRELLEWFAGQAVPCIAFAGRWTGLPLACVGPDKVVPYLEATRRLIALGHRRIVVLCARMRRLPTPARVERAFLAELAVHGIPTGAYNLPDWEETAEGLHAALDSLFRHTPPTALIIDEVPFIPGVLQFLARRGIQVPGQVSLVACDFDPAFAWCQPSMAHLRFDNAPNIRRIVRWATAVSQDRRDLKQTLYPAEFVPADTVGPAPKNYA
jgi:LacI family transcriptional regulator